MSSQAGRVRALITLAAAAAFAAAIVIAVSGAGAAVNSQSGSRLAKRCASAVEGAGRAPARAVPGSSEPQVAGELSIFRAARPSADALPAVSGLAKALAGGDASTYEPSASIRLNVYSGSHKPVYAVPAILARPTLPAGCAKLREFAALRASFALITREIGSGPGVCVIRTELSLPPSSPPVLPGRPRPRKKVRAVAACESLSAMGSYVGTFGGALTQISPATLVPDGVSLVTYALPDGRQVSAAVTDNILTIPTLPHPQFGVHHSSSELRKAFAAALPATITETGPDGAPVASFSRPTWLIPAYVRLLTVGRHFTSVTTSSFEGSYVACSARTHRCVAAVVTTECDSRDHRCALNRKIERYRYVTSRPPRGTSGTVVPAGPIRARVERYVVHPKKLGLVVSGTPDSHADVLILVNCFSRTADNTVSGASTPPRRLTLPARIPVLVPGHPRACDVDALVTSAQRGPIHARLIRR